MQNDQFNFIRQYCDTEGYRLCGYEKDLLYRILQDSAKYNGFISEMYTEKRSGRDYRDTWDSTNWQYRINIDDTLSIDKRWRHS